MLGNVCLGIEPPGRHSDAGECIAQGNLGLRQICGGRIERQRLADKLKAAGADVTLDVIEGAGHGGPQFTTPERLTLIMEFFARESCGWCTPCRDGLPWSVRILRAIENKQGRPGDTPGS